ncbi:AMP-binding protein [Gordonia sp. PP30]|uniref:class I adenylate-forming enzyme family protein n=1 Tax=Gordonia sp. PP30 TaxID=2935861 RepID=UPI00200039F3|nr:AMP-binding protein [Gordonia sp. PP30]UQE75249.1 AMP-binding protein [Gordonia sp. PP30]
MTTISTIRPQLANPELEAELLSALEFDHPTAIHALAHHVSSRGQKVAIHYGETGEQLTYREFDEKTDNIAANLVQLGLVKGARVGVLSTNPLTATLVMYACWKLGAVYAPLNHQYRGDLLAYVLRDSAPSVVVLDSQFHSAVTDIIDLLEFRPIFVTADDGDDRTLETVAWSSLLTPADKIDHSPVFADTANIIYTSGTTGPSKGVVQSHRWIAAYIWVGRRIIGPDDVVYNDLPMYHIGGAHFNVTRALWVGATVSLWNRFSPHAFWDRIEQSGATSAVLLDVMLPWLLNAEPSERDRYNSLNKVHLQPLPANHNEFATRFGIDFVTCGFAQSESGNALAGLIEEVPEGFGTPPDLYRGMSHAELTESFTSLGLPTMSGSQDTPKGFMGKPGLFTEARVVDEFDQTCAPGVVGELALRPRLPFVLFDGYLEKPAATAQANRNLWFHTGDAALATDDGGFCYVDRIGDRIRVRGENISGYHIEEMLMKHSAVSLAAVVAVPSTEGEEDDVIAFVEIAEGSRFDEDELRNHCAAVMPKFMRPRSFVHVDEIPRTPTNKIEKYKLRRSLASRDKSDR